MTSAAARLMGLAPGILAFVALTAFESARYAAVHAQSPLTTALVGGTVIDGTGAEPFEDAVIVITGDRISAVGPRTSVRIPSDAQVISAKGQWITPGLIDVHVHFFESGRSFSKPGTVDLTKIVPYEDEWRWTKARVPVTLASYLCAGVTTAASMGGPRFELDVREIARRSDKAPDVLVAYGPVGPLPPMRTVFPLFDGDDATRQASNQMEARAAVEQALTTKADFLKTGVIGGPLAAQEGLFFSDLLPGFVEESRRRSLPLMVHTTEVHTARQMLRGGVSRLAHPPVDASIDDEFVALAREQNAIVTSTLAVLSRWTELPDVPLLDIEKSCGDPQVIESWPALRTLSLPPPPPAAIELGRRQTAVAMKNLSELRNRGIEIAVGSDAGNLGMIHGPSIHQELRLMADAGIRPRDILVAATRGGARYLGKESELGTIAGGKIANMLILDADPMLDIRNMARIARVVKSGRIYQQRELHPTGDSGIN